MPENWLQVALAGCSLAGYEFLRAGETGEGALGVEGVLIGEGGTVSGVEAAGQAGDGGAVGEGVEAVRERFGGGAGVGEDGGGVVGEERGEVGAGDEAGGVAGDDGGGSGVEAGEVEEE